MTAANTVQTSRAVGALACQSNSYLRSLETEVVACVKAPQDVENAKSKKQKKQEAVVHDEWMIECADSVLFPEGGGQPSDHGILVPLSGPDQSPITVTNIQRQGLRCILYSPRPLAPGDKVRQEVDWKRRWDHMQQHTGQHLLSAIMMNDHGLKTLGWGMGAEGAMNYVDLQRRPTEEEVRAIQAACAEHIRDNVGIRLETPDDAKHEKLPGDYDKSEGVIRVIRIGDIDSNTYGHHHKPSSTQSVHGQNCRLSFVAGDRALALAHSSVGAVSSIAKLTSARNAPSEVIAKASEMCEAVSELRKAEKKLMLEVARYESERVKAVVQSGKNGWVHRADGGMEFINKVVAETKDIVRGTGRVVVLAIGEPKGTGPIVVVGDKESVAEMAEKVKEVVKNVKGGGGGEKWQGKVAAWQKSELAALKDLVEA